MLKPCASCLSYTRVMLKITSHSLHLHEPRKQVNQRKKVIQKCPLSFNIKTLFPSHLTLNRELYRVFYSTFMAVNDCIENIIISISLLNLFEYYYFRNSALQILYSLFLKHVESSSSSNNLKYV